MFFNIVGFIALVLVMLYISGVCLLAFFNYIGEYNIGGVPNEWYHKTLALLFVSLVIYLWYLLFNHCPFSINISM